MTQLVECLCSKYEALSSNPSAAKKEKKKTNLYILQYVNYTSIFLKMEKWLSVTLK
jgi:hypothetical protein